MSRPRTVAAWYAIDRIDNGGRPSAQRIVPELQRLGVGDAFPWSSARHGRNAWPMPHPPRRPRPVHRPRCPREGGCGWRATGSLLDQFIPHPEVDEYHQLTVQAPAAGTFAAAKGMDLQAAPVVKAIFWLRAVPAMVRGQPFRPHGPRGLLEETLALGFGTSRSSGPWRPSRSAPTAPGAERRAIERSPAQGGSR
jgi:hypothetical protein